MCCKRKFYCVTSEGLIRPHLMLVGSGCLHPSVIECFHMVLVHLQLVVSVVVCHAIATNGGVGGVVVHELCLGWIHVSVSALLRGSVGGLEAIVFGSIRWSVWSFRPSSPLRLPRLKCLLCYVVMDF